MATRFGKNTSYIFYGYGEIGGYKTHRLFHKLTQEIIFCQDVIFNELALIPKEGGGIMNPLSMSHWRAQKGRFYAFD